jgi:peptide/nickel transport system substrate-binding protein
MARMRRARRAAAALAVLALVSAAAGSGAFAARGSRSAASILRVGTTYYVDTLNPFIGIETNDTTAYTLVYPQLVQYGPGLKLTGDWARSWTHTKDGLTWTFHLRSGTWSDGKALTAQDAVWTIDLILRYRNGPASYLAGALDGVKSASAPNSSTLVVRYSRPVAPVLANLEQFFVLPQHVWAAHVGTNGKGIKGYHPEQSLPLVAGGAYTVTQFEQKGTTVFRPNPGFYGPKSRAAAVTLTYYTNATSMTSDLEHGSLDYVDALPYKSADALKGVKSVVVTEQQGDEVTNLGFNSNPLKSRNRELLSSKLKEAFEYATPRRQIIDVVFGGHAQPWANIISPWSRAEGWVNPAVKPLPYAPAKANAILDALGYKRGSNGVRVVPAATGAHAQAAHTMTYSVIVPNDLDFSGDRQFQILQTAYRKIGVVLRETPGGDGSQAYELIAGPSGKYLNADLYTWYWHPYIDPSFNLSVVTKAEWYNNSDTGFDDPQYDRWWRQQARQVNVAKRRALVWKMEAYLAQKRPYVQLVDTNMLTAHSSAWTGFQPNLWGYCKCFATAPHPTS